MNGYRYIHASDEITWQLEKTPHTVFHSPNGGTIQHGWHGNAVVAYDLRHGIYAVDGSRNSELSKSYE